MMSSVSNAIETSTHQIEVPVRWLPALRISIILMLLIVDVIFVLGIVPFYNHLTETCILPDCKPLVLSQSDVEALSSVGLTPAFYALSHLTVEIANFIYVNLFCIYFLRRFLSSLLGYVACIAFIQLLIMPNVFWAYLEIHTSLRPLGEFLLVVGLSAIFSLIYIFPDGRLVPRWSIIFLALGVIYFASTAAMAHYEDFTGTELSGIYFSPFMISLVAGIVFQVYRYKRVANSIRRRQMRWVIWGFSAFPVGVLGWGFFIEYLAFQPGMPRVWINLITMPIIMVLSVIPFTLALTLAIVEEKLWNIDMVINRTLVYTIVTAIIFVTYVFVIGLLSFMLGEGQNLLISLLATGTIALSFQVILQFVQRVVNRLMFGQRDEPQAILSNLSQQLQATIMPEDLLRVSTTAIGQSLRVPYVAITIQHRDEIITQAKYGKNGMRTQSFALVHRNETVGELIVGQRSPGEALNKADLTVLSSVAQQLGAIVYAVRLQTDLKQAREKLVIAREEERRRLRRDLHDGLGPALASLPLKIDAAIDLIAEDENTSLKLLGDVKREAQNLVIDVRRVVNDLRPPALDELGLVAALRGAISHTSNHPNSTLITFEADPVPHRIPAATEAAAYRITMEAVTNVIKHAQAGQCWVKLEFVTHPPRLLMTIEDDGVGIPHPVTPNVGLPSMRERAEELGGTFEMRPRPAGGTCICVTIPIPDESNTP